MSQPAQSPDLIAELRSAAQSGDPEAQARLGKSLLAKGGASVPEGAALIAAAAQKGHAEAASVAALLVGGGAASIDDWSVALSYLQQAAEGGWVPAQEQLILLCGEPRLADEAARSPAPDIWGRLRRGIDLKSWLAPAAKTVLSESPALATFDRFVSPQICDWIVALSQPGIARARVFDRATGAAQVGEARTNSAFEFDLASLDLVVLLVRARIAAATGHAPRVLENTNVLHYAVGEQFARHFDFFDPQDPGLAKEIAANGQRVATFLIYLNDTFEGAETEFPLLDRRHRCPKGGALFFRNVEPSGAPDRRTLHAGLAPTSGEKWLLSQWIRGAVA
jgi:prolyl 4-hydroxylase